MNMFLSDRIIASLWREKLIGLAPRLEVSHGKGNLLEKGDLKRDLGLDSLEILELAAYFHGTFHLMEGPVSLYLLQYQRVEEWLAAILNGANNWNRPMTFFTSGSTGAPKPCVHHKRRLLEEAREWYKVLAPKGLIWQLVSPIHLYGFMFGQLMPSLAGLGVLDARKISFAHMVKLMKESDWLIGFPNIYQALLTSQVQVPQGIVAISSTTPLEGPLWQRMNENGITIIDVYGSSETGGVGFKRFPEKVYELLSIWRREGHGLIPTIESNISSKVSLMDHIEWLEEDKFMLMDRKDEAVQIGGINVFPQKIAQQIEGLEGIQKCWVRKMNIHEGNRLKCWIIPNVPRTKWRVLERDCYQWIEENLSSAERPKHIQLSLQAPFNQMGKISDWPISQQVFS